MKDKQTGSVTAWIEGLKDITNSPDAQRKILKRFEERLTRYARRKLSGIHCSLEGPDDIACIAFQNFFEKSPEDFESLSNRNDLWKILCTIAARRAFDALRKHGALKNGGNQLVNESSLGASDSEKQLTFDQFPSGQEPPDFGVILADEIEYRLDGLRDEQQRQAAIFKMQGLKNCEIANKLSISLRGVERKLGIIRKKLESID